MMGFLIYTLEIAMVITGYTRTTVTEDSPWRKRLQIVDTIYEALLGETTTYVCISSLNVSRSMRLIACSCVHLVSWQADGYLDLYLANTGSTHNALLRNNAGSGFTQVTTGVVYTDRALNHMSEPFKKAMNNISDTRAHHRRATPAQRHTEPLARQVRRSFRSLSYEELVRWSNVVVRTRAETVFCRRGARDQAFFARVFSRLSIRA